MSNIDPSSARTAEDFVMLLRQARAMSELTFWQLEEAANAAGHELEPTVLAETLGLATLPDEDLVTALLAACGYPPDRIGHWLSVRDRLASAALPGPAPELPPVAPAGSGGWSSPAGFPAAAEPAWVPLLDPAPAPHESAGAHAAGARSAGLHNAGAHTAGLHAGGLHAGGLHAAGLHAGGLHAAGAHTAGLHAGGLHDAGGHSAGANDATASLPEVAVAAAARARHTLRIPGRGTRRARGSWLRPLLMVAAAAVVVAGGIAVIVSAVNDGEGSTGAPVYAPGSPRSDGTPQPSPSAQAEATATPSAAVSPSHSAPPVSAPPALAGVLRSGTATLQNGQSIDLDGGGSDPDVIVFGEGDSVRAGPSDRHFAAEPTATKQACAAVNGYQKTLQNLAAGNGVCVRTDKGRYAHLTISRTGPLAFSYVVWS